MGLRGSGKSTVGRALARARGAPFVDLDDLTAAALHAATPGEAFRASGEAAFREAEARALGVVFGRSPCVIALGGGTPTAPGAADLLRAARAGRMAFIVYLRASAAALRARLAHDDPAARPSLTGRGTLEEIEQVAAARGPLYASLADLTIDTDLHASAESAAFAVAAALPPPG